MLRYILFLKIYLYFSVGNGRPREPALCQLCRHTIGTLYYWPVSAMARLLEAGVSEVRRYFCDDEDDCPVVASSCRPSLNHVTSYCWLPDDCTWQRRRSVDRTRISTRLGISGAPASAPPTDTCPPPSSAMITHSEMIDINVYQWRNYNFCPSPRQTFATNGKVSRQGWWLCEIPVHSLITVLIHNSGHFGPPLPFWALPGLPMASYATDVYSPRNGSKTDNKQ